MLEEQRKTLLSEILEIRKSNKTISERERNPDISPGWGYYRSKSESYDYSFSGVLNESIPDLLKRRSAHELPTVVLDLMSPGEMLKTLHLDAGLSVTLGDRRNEKLKRDDQKHNLDVLEADILSKRAWSDIQKWLNNHDYPAFDFIFCRPIMGLDLPYNTDLYYYLINHTWQILSQNNGLLVTETPYNEDQLLSSWRSELNLYPGINAVYQPTHKDKAHIDQKGVLSLTKDISAPYKLPVIDLNRLDIKEHLQNIRGREEINRELKLFKK